MYRPDHFAWESRKARRLVGQQVCPNKGFDMAARNETELGSIPSIRGGIMSKHRVWPSFRTLLQYRPQCSGVAPPPRRDQLPCLIREWISFWIRDHSVFPMYTHSLFAFGPYKRKECPFPQQQSNDPASPRVLTINSTRSLSPFNFSCWTNQYDVLIPLRPFLRVFRSRPLF